MPLSILPQIKTSSFNLINSPFNKNSTRSQIIQQIETKSLVIPDIVRTSFELQKSMNTNTSTTTIAPVASNTKV